MKTGKQKCGCYIDRTGHMPESIIYCPMHSAAPDLLEALQFALYALEDDDPEITIEAQKASRAAIAKATADD